MNGSLDIAEQRRVGNLTREKYLCVLQSFVSEMVQSDEKKYNLLVYSNSSEKYWRGTGIVFQIVAEAQLLT